MKKTFINEPKASVTTVRFILSEIRREVVYIPAGTRVTAGDGIYFATDDFAEVTAGADLHCERHAFVVRADEFPFRFLPVTAVFGIVRGSGLFEIIEITDFLVAGFEDNVPEISDHLHHRPSYVG